MSQEKRSLLAVALSLAIFAGWYWYLAETQPPTPTTPSATVAANTQGKSTAPLPQETSNETTLFQESSLGTLTEINTPLLSLTFSNQGGEITQAVVKGYYETVEKDSPETHLFNGTTDRALRLVCEQCSFVLPPLSSYRLTAQNQNSMTYVGQSRDVRITRTVLWDENRYLLDVKIKVDNLTRKSQSGRLGLGGIVANKEVKTGFLAKMAGPPDQKGVIYSLGGTVEREAIGKDQDRSVQGLLTWAGWEGRYFLSSLIARQVSDEEQFHYSIKGLQVGHELYYPKELIEPGRPLEARFSYYVGPKKFEILKTVGLGLENSIDFGWFGIVAKPILQLLHFFQKGVQNWGLSIILLTILVKTLMNPLQIKSLKSMKEMQKLQPKLKEMREKYKNDKERLNMEMMQLFKSHKVNPMGGCLPLLIQMPIYIALYRVLYSSIEIYHAPFFWFYRDLSASDPYYILPILLGLFMVLQQKMTPSPSADPAQRKMMMIMPVMFTGFMLILPVGLVLYILVNTVMTVVQQWMYNHDVRWRDLVRGRLRLSN